MAKPRVARQASNAEVAQDSDEKRKNLQFRAPDRAYAARVSALARAKGLTEPALLRLAVDKYLAEAESDLAALRQEIRERWESAAKDELAALAELAELSSAQVPTPADIVTVVPADARGAMSPEQASTHPER